MDDDDEDEEEGMNMNFDSVQIYVIFDVWVFFFFLGSFCCFFALSGGVVLVIF
jgi:hypothetical protein